MLALTETPSLMIQILLVQLDVIVLKLIAEPLRFAETFNAPSLTAISVCEKSIWKYDDVMSLWSEK